MPHRPTPPPFPRFLAPDTGLPDSSSAPANPDPVDGETMGVSVGLAGHPPDQSFAVRFHWRLTRYQEGLSDGQIAFFEDVPTGIVTAWREAMRLPALPADPLTLAFLPPYVAGIELAVIATQAGMDLAQVQQWCQSHGIAGARTAARIPWIPYVPRRARPHAQR